MRFRDHLARAHLGWKKLSTKAKWAVAVSIGVFLGTIIRLNIENWATENKLDKLYQGFQLPGWLVSAWGYITGPFGVGFGLGALIFAFWDPIARYMARLQAGAAPVSTSVSADPGGPDTTIGAAIHYLLLESEWGHGKDEGMIVQALDDAAERGTLDMWGRPCVNWRPEGKETLPPQTLALIFDPNEVPIRKDEWLSMRLWQGSMMHPHPRPEAPHMTVRRHTYSVGFHSYGYVRVSRQQMELRYPPLFKRTT